MKKILCVLGSAIYSCGISYLVYLFIKWFSEAHISSGWHIFLSVILIFAFSLLGWWLSYPLRKMAKFAIGCVVVSIIPFFYCMWFTLIYPWFFHTHLFLREYIPIAVMIDIALIAFFVIMWARTASEAEIRLGPVNYRGVSDLLMGFNGILMMLIIIGGFAICFSAKDAPAALFSSVGFILILTPLITSLLQKRLRKEIENDMVCLFDERTEKGRELNRDYIDKYSAVCRFFVALLIISIAVGIYVSVVYFSNWTHLLENGWYWYDGQRCSEFNDIYVPFVVWAVPLYIILNIINIPSLWLPPK